MNLKNIDFKNMDKRTITYLGIGCGSILLLIIILIVLKIIVGGRIGSKQLEARMKNGAINYYEKYKEKLPTISGNTVSVSIDELVKAGNLKSLDKLLKKGLTCDGKVNVSNNNGYYLYQPIIKCSDNYETNLLYKKILNDNKVTTSGNGLYSISNYYVFRGENLNNYVKFADMNWQIVRINNDNSIRLILTDNLDSVVFDDRYNTIKNQNVGKNDYSISRIKDTVTKYFNNKKVFDDTDKSYIVPQSLCIGSRNKKSTLNDGLIECSKKLDNQPIGLLQANEYMLASLEPSCKNLTDNQCGNYNYLSTYNAYWTLTANAENSYEVYKVSGTLYPYSAYTYAQPRLVINLSSNLLYTSGNGTLENPYIVK